MEIKIIEQKENPLFNRKEISAEISSEKTPSKAEVQELISKKLSVSEENIKIKTIVGQFGSHTFITDANIYASKEDREKTEQKTKQEIEAEKKALEEQKKAEAEAKAEEEAKKAEEEKPAEESSEETPVENSNQEEVKEENKEEEKVE